jgi:hypothetical protein
VQFECFGTVKATDVPGWSARACRAWRAAQALNIALSNEVVRAMAIDEMINI